MLFNRISLCIALVALTVKSSEAASTRFNKRDSLNSCISSNIQSEQIKESFLFAYNGYRNYAWGHDELLPVSKSFSDSR